MARQKAKDSKEQPPPARARARLQARQPLDSDGLRGVGDHTSHAGSYHAGGRVLLALPAAMAAAVVALATGCGSGGQTIAKERVIARTSTEGAHRRVAQTGGQSPTPRQRSPATLPQTRAFPSATSAPFEARMAALWNAIVTGSAERALEAFFPEQAYVRLKAIPSAGADWRERLVHELRLDIAAAHALLGAGSAGAQVLSVRVPSEYGHWVQPGVCFNGIGYYEVPNARLVYREDGKVRSLGIASMISWRGQWYVVHLGAVLRSADEGVVDEPSAGVGASVDSGTC